MNRGYPFLFDTPANVTGITKLDARVRILAALIVVSLIAVVLDPVAYLILTLTIAFGCLVQRLPMVDYLRIVKIFFPMAAVTLILHLLFNRSGSSAIATLLGLSITREALIAGLLFCWRLGLFLLSAICLTRMISADDFARGIWRTLTPLSRLGITLDGVCMALWVAIRFIPTIFTQYHQIVFAQKARGATFEGGLVARTRKMTPLLVPVTVAAIRRSDILADALTVRGWGVGVKRTFYGKHALGLGDYVFVVGSLIWGGAILWIGL